MKRTIFFLALITIVGLQSVQAQPGPQVTKEHKILQQDLGSWDVKMKLWALGPDQDPITGKCEEHNRMLGNGLWLISDFKGSFQGIAFEGHGTFGYNANKKKYVGTWIDNMNPHMSQMEGTYDAETKTMTMYSTGIDAETGKKTKTKNVGKYIDKDTRTFTMSMLAPGTDDKYIKMMELHYTRKTEK